MTALFADRADAARRLADRLAGEHLPPPCVVLALPRGGVPIGAEVARRLGAPLDLLLVRKIGAPWQPELAVAALADGDGPAPLVDEEVASATGADAAYIAREAAREWQELERRRAVYLRGRAPLPLQGRTAIVVDDGIATGTTARAALGAVRRRGAARIVLAVPVAPHAALMRLRSAADRVICLAEPKPFHAIGQHYADFRQLRDDEVVAALAADDQRVAGARAPGR